MVVSAAQAARRTCSSIARPATWCATFGSRERIRVPLPAARMTTPTGLLTGLIRMARYSLSDGCCGSRGPVSVLPACQTVATYKMASRLGRQDSNLGSWIQSPLPYRLATPERLQASTPTALAAREHQEVYHTARHLPRCLLRFLPTPQKVLPARLVIMSGTNQVFLFSGGGGVYTVSVARYGRGSKRRLCGKGQEHNG